MSNLPKQKQTRLILATLILVTTTSLGCSDVQFATSKQDVLSKTSVFTGENEGGPGDFSDPPAQYLCSNNMTSDRKSNVKKSVQLQLKVKSKDSGQVLCEFNSGVKRYIQNFKKLPLSFCTQLKANQTNLEITLIDTAVQSGNLYLGNNEVLYDFNDGDRTPDCDRRASPLIVDMRKDSSATGGIQLTPPTDGIWFDILGENSFPRPHTKKQISWIRNADFMFIVKPRHGQVLGINEMFGDNTRGPDGRFAADGFEALAKFDLNNDGRIDPLDPVFTELRLWSDKNFDGQSQTNELLSFSSVGLTAIDLIYDPSYAEEDRYGNQTVYKSVVDLKDGTKRLLFDLWFRYL